VPLCCSPPQVVHCICGQKAGGWSAQSAPRSGDHSDNAANHVAAAQHWEGRYKRKEEGTRERGYNREGGSLFLRLLARLLLLRHQTSHLQRPRLLDLDAAHSRRTRVDECESSSDCREGREGRLYFYLQLGLLADLLARCQSERADTLRAFPVLLLFACLGKDIAVAGARVHGGQR